MHTFKTAASTALLCTLLGLTGCLSSGGSSSKSGTPPSESPAPFAFQPITLEKMEFPPGFGNALGEGGAIFLPDGIHILATSSRDGVPHLIRGNVETGETECVTCTATTDGEPFSGLRIANPFPDGKRLFLGLINQIFECYPSLVDCQTYKIFPFEIAPADNPFTLVQGTSPKLAPDGEHVGYSSIRLDGIQEMVVARLVREGDKYVAIDPRVINPIGPASLDDTDIEHWSLGSALYELKTFTRGGAAVTYVQVGGANAFNPDTWEVDLKTGARTRLTAHPDWDEDLALSPDGQLLSQWSSRGYDMFTWTGSLLPFRSFIDAGLTADLASRMINTPGNLYCAGPHWLMPPTGDNGGSLSGQPIIDLIHDNVRVNVNVMGSPSWSPKSNRLALALTSAPGGGVYYENAPDYLVFAHLTAKQPTDRLPIVSSEVGDWAITPAEYKTTFSHSGTVTLDGPGGGTVTLTLEPSLGVLEGAWSQAFDNYSEDGETFLNGRMQIVRRSLTGIPFGPGETVYKAELIMSGANHGYLSADITFTKVPTITSEGSVEVSYNGTTVMGPPDWIDDPSGYCPEQQTPSLPQLEADIRKLDNNGNYEVEVTASVAGMGLDQTEVSTSPVRHALISGDGIEVHTDVYGIAKLKAADGIRLDITAGDTLKPTTITTGG